MSFLLPLGQGEICRDDCKRYCSHSCLLSMGAKEALFKQRVDTSLIGIIHALYIILKY